MKIIIAALIGAVVLAWVMGVTLFLETLPDEIMRAVDNEIAVKVQGQTATYDKIVDQTLNSIFLATWVWAIVGLVFGAGVGWYLTRSKTR